MRQHPLFFPYLALASVCFFWGATYLGIRIALESFPPLLLVGIPFLIGSVIMLAIAFSTKAKFPQGRQAIISLNAARHDGRIPPTGSN